MRNRNYRRFIFVIGFTILLSLFYNLITGKPGLVYGDLMRSTSNLINGWKEVNIDKEKREIVSYDNLPKDVKIVFSKYKENINKPDDQRVYIEMNLTKYKIQYLDVGFLQSSYILFYKEGASEIAILNNQLKIKKEFGGILVFYKQDLYFPKSILDSKIYYKVDLSKYLLNFK
ncbi:MAG: hypothetical protein WCY77_10635 [Weeksellaceae bacterium]